MVNRFNSLELRLATLLLLACLAFTGCATPELLGRWQVSADLDCRIGQVLSREKSPCEIVIPDLVNWEDGLSESEAAAVGLWNNPAYQRLLADLQISQADVIQAHQITNPEMTNMFPLSAKQWELTLMVPLDVLIVRPLRTDAAQRELERVAERLVQDGLNVVRDVRVAYINVAQAEDQLVLARYGLQLRNELDRIAKARLQAGAESELGISAMRTDALFSKDQVVDAERLLALAREQLRFLLGIELSELTAKVSPLSKTPAVELNVDTLVEEALSSRPDLLALDMAIDAAGERARLARYDYFNFRAALPDINGKGDKGSEAGPGLRFNLPIFNQNQGALARAEAEVERLRRQLIEQQDTVALEVRQASIELTKAQERHAIWQTEAVPQAQSAVAAAQQALEEDATTPLLVLETTRQLLAVRAREIQAKADIRRAIAELERSVGRRLLEIQDAKTEALPPPEADEPVKEAMP